MCAADREIHSALPPSAGLIISLAAGGAILCAAILILYFRQTNGGEDEESDCRQAAWAALKASTAAMEKREHAQAEEAASHALQATETLRQNPELISEIRATAFLLRGKARAADGDPARLRKAIADFDRCLSLTPRDFFALYCRGCAHYRLGEIANAEKDLNAALTIKPDYAPAYLARAAVRRAQQNHADAEADERRAQELQAAQLPAR